MISFDVGKDEKTRSICANFTVFLR